MILKRVAFIYGSVSATIYGAGVYSIASGRSDMNNIPAIVNISLTWPVILPFIVADIYHAHKSRRDED